MTPACCWFVGFPRQHADEFLALLQNKYDAIPVEVIERFVEGMDFGEDGLIFLWDSPMAIGQLKKIFENNPRQQIVVLSSQGDSERAAEMMKLGIIDYRLFPVPDEVLPSYFRQFSHTRSLTRMSLSRQHGHQEFLTRDIETIRLLDQAALIAASRASVLVTGESGTGKERIARFIHQCSDRSNETFLGVNCAAIPEGVLESELFGHEKGAFTGASESRPGKFELAHNGTLLLDEITEMPIHLQAKLLRVLQEGEVDRVGGRVPVSVNVRIIATSNRDIVKSIEKGEFREDLYFRLNVVSVSLPPLRQRPKDIEFLAQHFLEKFADEYGVDTPSLDASAMAAMMAYSWPGNVRELENMMHRLTLLHPGRNIGVNELTFPRVAKPAGDTGGLDVHAGMTIRDMERALIQETLEHVKGNRTEAARLLGISIRTLRNKLKLFEDGTAFA